MKCFSVHMQCLNLLSEIKMHGTFTSRIGVGFNVELLSTKNRKALNNYNNLVTGTDHNLTLYHHNIAHFNKIYYKDHFYRKRTAVAHINIH